MNGSSGEGGTSERRIGRRGADRLGPRRDSRGSEEDDDDKDGEAGTSDDWELCEERRDGEENGRDGKAAVEDEVEVASRPQLTDVGAEDAASAAATSVAMRGGANMLLLGGTEKSVRRLHFPPLNESLSKSRMR